MAKNGDFSFEIKEHISDLSEPNKKGWKKELNSVSWNGGEPVYDIRQWDETHEHCGKGVTLSYEELAILVADVQDKGIC